MDLDPLSEFGVPRDQPVDCLEEVDVRASEDVDALPTATEQRACQRLPPLLPAELGVEVSGVHDAKSSVRPARRWTCEIVPVEPARDRDDRLFGELGEGCTDSTDGLACRHDDCGCGAQQPPHL